MDFTFCKQKKRKPRELGNVFVSYSSITLALACSEPGWIYTRERRCTESKGTLISECTAKTYTLYKKGHLNIQTHVRSHMQEVSFLPKSHFTLC